MPREPLDWRKRREVGDGPPMPEGDTVYLAAKRLDQALRGRTLRETDFRIPRLATVDLQGVAVREVVSRGKHILMRFDDDSTLHTHFRMDGTWHLYREGDSWRGGPDHAIRAVLRTEDRVAVGYRLHDVAWIPTRDEHQRIGHLGPDICADDWDEDQALTRLRSAGDRSVAVALVDQRIIAGIGNIYRCESLFIAGLTPSALVSDVDDALLELVVRTARELLMRNRNRASQSTTGDERRAHFVYGRRSRRCYRCAAPIRATRADRTEPHRATSSADHDRGSANEQTVFWCPRCQPSPDDPTRGAN